jgi:endoglucanase
MPRHLFLLLTVLLLLVSNYQTSAQTKSSPFQYLHGAIVRGDNSSKDLTLVFTGDEYAEGGIHIARVLRNQGIKGSFFFTGKFYRNPEFQSLVRTLAKDGHFLGAHSDQHLLYCSWENLDSLLVTKKEFMKDLKNNYIAMYAFKTFEEETPFFLPPFEWYNDSISAWTNAMGLQLVNHTSGTLSHADYTVPGTRGYRSSQEIFDSILEHESEDPNGLNGFILLSHIGTVDERTDKFYFHLQKLIIHLKESGYSFKRIDELL